MSNVEILSDRLARAKLESTQKREAERRERIFNDNVRLIGVDKEALDAQVEEKRKRDQEAKKEKDTYEAKVIHNAKKTCILFNQRERENRALREEIVSFRQQQQQPWQRREFDLNDPDLWKKINQDETPMMPPGLLGEDFDCEGRQQRQKEQLRDWLIQQQTEQEEERRQEILEDQRYHENKLKIHREILDLRHQEKERRRAIAVATKDYNLALNEEKRRRESVSNDHVQDQPLAAAPDACVGVPGPCCCVDPRPEPEPSQWVTEFQKHQIEEKRRADLERKEEEDRMDQALWHTTRTGVLMERQQARLIKQQRRELDRTNAQLAQLNKQLKPDIEKGAIYESFFNKFNTCSR